MAAIVGIRLFDADESTLSGRTRQIEDKLALLPKSVRRKGRVIADGATLAHARLLSLVARCERVGAVDLPR